MQPDSILEERLSRNELLLWLLQDQGNSDGTLDDVACMLGCTRSSLHGTPHCRFRLRWHGSIFSWGMPVGVVALLLLLHARPGILQARACIP